MLKSIPERHVAELMLRNPLENRRLAKGFQIIKHSIVTVISKACATFDIVLYSGGDICIRLSNILEYQNL